MMENSLLDEKKYNWRLYNWLSDVTLDVRGISMTPSASAVDRDMASE